MSKSTRAKSGLATVHNLYIMQCELQEKLDTGLKTKEDVQEAKKCLKEFTALLKQVDPQYMGGEDVLKSLHKMQEKMSARVEKARKKA